MSNKNEAGEPRLGVAIVDTRARTASSVTDVDPSVTTNTSSPQDGPITHLTVIGPPVSIAREYSAESTDSLERQNDAVVRQQDTTSTAENVVNARRMQALQSEFTARLLATIIEEPFEYGVDGKADALVRKQLERNALATRSWLNDLFLGNYPNIPVCMGILRLVARLDYHDIRPEGPTMAIAALAHDSEAVRECGVRAIESWGEPSIAPILEKVRVQEAWLRDYIEQVVADLRREYVARPR